MKWCTFGVPNNQDAAGVWVCAAGAILLWGGIRASFGTIKSKDAPLPAPLSWFSSSLFPLSSSTPSVYSTASRCVVCASLFCLFFHAPSLPLSRLFAVGYTRAFLRLPFHPRPHSPCRRMLSYSQVLRSTFRDCAGGGLYLGNVNETHQTDAAQQMRGITVADNVIEHIGTEYQGSTALATFCTVDTIIEHNLIAHVPYTAISFNWPVPQLSSYSYNNTIRNNDVQVGPSPSRSLCPSLRLSLSVSLSRILLLSLLLSLPLPLHLPMPLPMRLALSLLLSLSFSILSLSAHCLLPSVSLYSSVSVSLCVSPSASACTGASPSAYAAVHGSDVVSPCVVPISTSGSVLVFGSVCLSVSLSLMHFD